MKIVVIGGTGLIGSKLVNRLRDHGHEAVAASPHSGVNSLTGEGLAEVLRGASVVVDVSESPSWEDAAALLEYYGGDCRDFLKIRNGVSPGLPQRYTVCPMKIERETTYFLRVTLEDIDRKCVKLWASQQAAMEVPLETETIGWQQLRRDLSNLGMFGPSILDEAEKQLFNNGRTRLPHTNLHETHFKTLGLYD